MRDHEAGTATRHVVLDLRHLNQVDLSQSDGALIVWDLLHTAASLQGIVNRHHPRLFILFMDVDVFWWEQLHKPDQWLDGIETTQTDDLHEVIRFFADELRGVVTYREMPWSASNVASSIAGIENRLCLRDDRRVGSLATRLRNQQPALFSDTLELVASDGTPIWEQPDQQQTYDHTPSVKNNAYRWLAARDLATGHFSPNHLGYYLDAYWLTHPDKQPIQNCTLTNHDYFISRRSMILDLNAWHDEASVDEPKQQPGLDLQTFQQILRSYHDLREPDTMLHVGGFTPWAWKYSDDPGAGSAHHGVQSEWELIRILSAYDAYLDADAISLAGMANASFYQHFPLRDHYPQPNGHEIEQAKHETSPVPDKAYVLFYMGDYDAAAWFNQELPRLYQDPARGTLDLCWAFNPNLDQRAPHAMHYARVWASPRDHFVAGDCGAGYVSPGMLESPRLDPELPDGYRGWIEHCKPYYQRYDLSVTGFIIEGRGPAIGDRGLDAYAEISPGGTIAHRHLPPTGLHESGMPYTRMTADIDGEPEQVAEEIRDHVKPAGHQFLIFRSVLKGPGWISEVMEQLKRYDHQGRIEFLDPHTFMNHIRRYELTTPPAPDITIDTERVRDMLSGTQSTP